MDPWAATPEEQAKTDEYERLDKLIVEHPGEIAFHLIDDLDSQFRIFVDAANRVHALLQAAASVEVGGQILSTFNGDSAMRMFDNTLDGLLSGYLAASSSLIEQTRARVLQADVYLGTAVRDEFAEQTEIVKALPEALFAHPLRSYRLHTGRIDFSYESQIGRDDQVCRVLIPTELLFRRSYNWNRAAKDFIESQAPAIDLLAFISTYTDAAFGLYGGLLGALQRHHAADFDGRDDLVRAQMRLVTDGAFDDPDEWKQMIQRSFTEAMRESDAQQPPQPPATPA